MPKVVAMVLCKRKTAYPGGVVDLLGVSDVVEFAAMPQQFGELVLYLSFAEPGTTPFNFELLVALPDNEEFSTGDTGACDRNDVGTYSTYIILDKMPCRGPGVYWFRIVSGGAVIGERRLLVQGKEA